jgi:cytochrome c553
VSSILEKSVKTIILYVLVLLGACMFHSPAALAQEGMAATAPLSTAERSALTPSREMIEMGGGVAERACADCHGMDGISAEPGQPHLAGQRTVYLYRVLQSYQARQRGNDAMTHSIGFLNDEALLAIAAYYASLAPALAPAATGEEPQADGGDPFSSIRDDMKKCVKCHGADGNSSGSGMPNLTAQSAEYFVHSMQAYAAGERGHKLMTKLVSDLDEQAINEMAVFYAVQKPLRKENSSDGDAKAGELAAEPCAACHGDDGNASGNDMPTLAGQDARYFVKAMQAYKNGTRQHEKMFEAAENLSEAEMANLAAFYASQEPVRRNVRTPLTTSEWIGRCERCHGIDGNSTDPRFPMLAGQDEDYLASALKAYAGEARGSSTMHAMAAPLSQADVARIARHYATRTPKAVVYMQLPCEDMTEP